jgi:thioredoxin 2
MAELVQVVCPHCSTVNRLPAQRLGDRGSCGRCKQPLFSGHPVELDGTGFAAQVGRSDIPVLVDFWAPWCGPCRSMAPHFKRAAELLEPQCRLAKLNTEEHPQVAAQFVIRSIPTLILFRHGREAARQSGAMDAESLVRWVRGAAE